MATKTTFLKLTKPLNNEYQDTWDQPVNNNIDLIDSWAEGIDQELSDARSPKSSLREFLEVSLETDGSLKPAPEVVLARNSFCYGDETDDQEDFDLNGRVSASEKEIFDAREGHASIRLALATKNFSKNEVISGLKNTNGYPTWMGYTGVNVQVDGSGETLWVSIGGKLAHVRNLKQITISGATGVKYLYADINPDGEIIVNGDPALPALGQGTVGSDGTKVRVFDDQTQDFTTQNIRVGDVLELLGTSLNAGRYVIAEIAPGGDTHKLKIKGIFPGGATTALKYYIKDMVGVTLGFTDDNTAVDGRFFIGEADWDGTIMAIRPIHFDDTFISEWRSVDVTTNPTFTEVWNHNLFDDALDVRVQVSSSNNGTTPIEELSTSNIGSDLAVTRANTLALSPTTPQAITGDVTVTLSGGAYPARSVAVKWTRYTATIKNLRNNLFYKDYDGASKTTGYVRVVISKMRK